ncbi:hypothetical protein V7S43_017698 [Phytophthora oleae]|uniref:Uncharacterized protein n=1 Tax=Phytophthora oleae TaxID=2107226 RepID=A0ABD3EWL2_9STRA
MLSVSSSEIITLSKTALSTHRWSINLRTQVSEQMREDRSPKPVGLAFGDDVATRWNCLHFCQRGLQSLHRPQTVENGVALAAGTACSFVDLGGFVAESSDTFPTHALEDFLALCTPT